MDIYQTSSLKALELIATLAKQTKQKFNQLLWQNFVNISPKNGSQIFKTKRNNNIFKVTIAIPKSHFAYIFFLNTNEITNKLKTNCNIDRQCINGANIIIQKINKTRFS